MRLLVVEDEEDLAHTLKTALEEEQFAVDLAGDGETGLLRVASASYDAAIVDLMLPKLDGWSLIAAARARGIRTPMMVLTARDTVSDRVRGLNLGADDYLTKPFALSELVARVHAIIRRSYGLPSPRLTIEDVEIDMAAKRVYRLGLAIELTSREYAVLELLALSRHRLVSRDRLRAHLYDDDTTVSSNVIDVHVAAIRRKLGSTLIRTRRGEGYIIDA
jgi:two-component system OmpR family response regulator